MLQVTMWCLGLSMVLGQGAPEKDSPPRALAPPIAIESVDFPTPPFAFITAMDGIAITYLLMDLREGTNPALCTQMICSDASLPRICSSVRWRLTPLKRPPASSTN